MLCLNSRNVNNSDLHDYSIYLLFTQHRHDGDWDKIKKKLAGLKKTHGHLSLPRLYRIIMQQKVSAKVEKIRVVSLKVSIGVPKF